MSTEAMPIRGSAMNWDLDNEVARHRRATSAIKLVVAGLLLAAAGAALEKMIDNSPGNSGDPSVVDTGDPSQNPGPNPQQTDGAPPEPPVSTTSIEPVPPSISPTSSTNNGYIVIEM